MLPSYAHGPIGTTAESFLPVPSLLENKIGDVCATWACMLAEMPVEVGGSAPWPSEQVFACTPEKNYKLNDMDEFLRDVASSTVKREFGQALFPGVRELASKMKAPPVPTQIIYSDGSDTIAQVAYDSSDLSKPPKVKSSEPGDGTIIAASIERVADHWVRLGSQAILHKAPGSISHKDLIACEFTVDLVRRLVLGLASAPQPQTMSYPTLLKGSLAASGKGEN
jgi:hypothetical protein